jgi:hypothetical protein
VFADETSGEVESYAERFRGIVGEDVRRHLRGAQPPAARRKLKK